MKKALLFSVVMTALLIGTSALPNRVAAQDGATESAGTPAELEPPDEAVEASGYTAGIADFEAAPTSGAPAAVSQTETLPRRTDSSRVDESPAQNKDAVRPTAAQSSPSGRPRVVLSQVPEKAPPKPSEDFARGWIQPQRHAGRHDSGEPIAGLEKRPDKIRLMTESANRRERARGRNDGSLLSLALTTAARLAFVLVLAYVTILVLKLVTSRKNGAHCSGGHLRVVDTARLSATNSLHVVSAGGKLFLIGCSGNRTDLLGELGSADELDTAAASTGRFVEYLSKYSREDTTPARRLAGLLRDCAVGMRQKCADIPCGREETSGNEA